MVKFVVKVVGFMVVLAFLIGSLENCEGPLARCSSDLLDPTEGFGCTGKNGGNDKEGYITDDDISNADPMAFYAYVNIRLSQINQNYVSYNSTNIRLSQEINPVFVKVDNYNQTITQQTNYISNSNINQQTLLQWTDDNRNSINLLNNDYTNLVNKTDELKKAIEALRSNVKDLKQAMEANKKHFTKYLQALRNEKVDKSIIETKTDEYKTFQKELNERLEKLTERIQALTKELNANTENLKQLKKAVGKCIDKLIELNKKLDKLIQQGGETLPPMDTDYFYIIDTEEGLIDKGIINSDGADDLNVRSNPDKIYFAILTDKDKSLTLGREKDKFEVLSDMPADSYEFRVINQKDVLVIKDIKRFWSKTKYLVIVKKKTLTK